MMAQGELEFKFEVEHQGEGMTGIGGIGPYLDLACRSGMVSIWRFGSGCRIN
jgi:hypothetical protein